MASDSKMASSLGVVAINVLVLLYMFWHFVIESRHYVEEKLEARRQSTEQEVELSAMALSQNQSRGTSDTRSSSRPLSHDVINPVYAQNMQRIRDMVAAPMSPDIRDLLAMHLPEGEFSSTGKEEHEASQIPTMGNSHLTSDQDKDDKDLSKREEDDLVLSV